MVGELKCTCCNRIAEEHKSIACSVCKKVFFHQCVELTTSEIRTIKQKKKLSRSCTKCTSVSSSGIDQLKALIIPEVMELKALIDKQASTSESFHFEEVVQEVFDGYQRKNNLIIFGIQENQSLQTSADRQNSDKNQTALEALSYVGDTGVLKPVRLGRIILVLLQSVSQLTELHKFLIIASLKLRLIEESLMNARGLNSKLTALNSNVGDAEYDVIALVETWLSSGFYSSEVFCEDYTVFRTDRDFVSTQTGRGGVVLVACQLNFFCLPIDVGDFNISHFVDDASDDPKIICFNNFLHFVGFGQYNHVHNSSQRLLDLIVSDKVVHVTREELPLVTEDEYHPALKCIVSVDQPRNNNSISPNTRNTLYNFRKANFVSLYQVFLACNWGFLHDAWDSSKLPKAFHNKVYSILDVLVPRVKHNSKNYPCWFTPEIIYLIRSKAKYRQSYKNHNRPNSYTDFSRVRKEIKNRMTIA
nr:unnamed protein product [Callosobruchus analis]